jgi:tetratricopeptide (TPR) repeat protein
MAVNEQKAEALVEQGLQLYSQGQLTEALDRWTQALDLVPGHPRAQEYLKYVTENREALEERFQFAAEAESSRDEGYKEQSTSEMSVESLQARIEESREIQQGELPRVARQGRPPLSVMKGGGHGGAGFRPHEETPVGGVSAARARDASRARQVGVTTRSPETAGASSDDVDLSIQEVVAIATEGNDHLPSTGTSSLELQLDDGELDLDEISPDVAGRAGGSPGPGFRSDDFSLSQLEIDDDGGGSIDLDASAADELVLEQRDAVDESHDRDLRGAGGRPRRGSDEVDLGLDSSPADMDGFTRSERDDLMELMFEEDQGDGLPRTPSPTAGTALPAGGGFVEDDATPSKKYSPEDVERLTFSTPELDEEDGWEASGHASSTRGESGAPETELVLRAADLAEGGELEESLDLCHKALDLNPENERAHELLERLQKRLLETYTAEIGDLDGVPSVLVARQEIVWQKMDHRAGFLLSRIDGMLTYEEIIDVSGMNRFEVSRILVQLLREGIIGRS